MTGPAEPPDIRALLVEDDEEDAMLVRDLLSQVPHARLSVDWVAGFDDAVARLERGGYDVCLVDRHLGAHDGIELIRLATERGWGAPLILLTGRGDAAADIAAMEAGAADFLGKSQLSPATLGRSIRYAVQHRRMEEARIRLAAERAAREHAEAVRSRLELEVEERTRAESALRAREAELRTTVAELARSNAELEQFAYVSSHDLQEPLRTIATFTALLRRNYQGRLGPEADEYIEFVLHAVQRMHDLIGALLDYSKAGQGPSFGPVDCEAVFDATVAQMRAAIDSAGASITRGPLPRIEGDAVQLGQLFQNLLANGLKFSGGGAPVVRVEAQPSDAGWEFSFRDNGIGIAPEHRERIFLLFRRLHGRSEYPGTGLGLAICKRIVERHGGQIWVDSTPGQGSTFRFFLPSRQRTGTGELTRGAPASRPE